MSLDNAARNSYEEHLGYVAQSNADPKNPIELFKQNFVRDKLSRITEKTEVVNGVDFFKEYAPAWLKPAVFQQPVNPYDPNTCGNFVRDAIEAGKK
jgi:hypothetical protein